MTTWTSENGINTSTWSSIAFGTPSGVNTFVAVSNGPTSTNIGRIMTSSDGITWISRNAPSSTSSNAWSCVAYVTSSIFVGSAFVAMASNATTASGSVITSPDGVTWTSQTGPSIVEKWSSLSSNGSVIVATSFSGSGSTNRCASSSLSSTIGTSWSNDTSANTKNYVSVSVNSSNNFCAVANDGTTHCVMVSTNNGSTWTAGTTNPTSGVWNGIATNNTIWVAVGNAGVVMTTTVGNEANWTAQTSHNTLNWTCVTYGDGYFVALSSSGSGNRVMTSPDGITWTLQTSSANNNWISVAYSSTLTKFVTITGDSVSNNVMVGTITTPCILGGMKILTVFKLINNTDYNEKYVLIENLQIGDLIKTHNGKIIPVKYIGFLNIINSYNTNFNKQLYRYSKQQFDFLTDDLIVTGGHSRLVESLTDEEIKLSKNYRNELCKIDNYYLLLSCIDSGAEVYNDLENFTVYNISLESDNLDENFGIFSNGMLIESCGINYLKKYMQLKV